MNRYPTLSAPLFAGVLVLLSSVAGHAEDLAPSPSLAAPNVAAQALDKLEAHAPKDWQDQQAIADTNTRVIALVGSNILQSADDFRRAARLLQLYITEYRVGRVYYELLLTAAAKQDPEAEKELAAAWDTILRLLGRPLRLDVYGLSKSSPEFNELEPAPACIQAVLRDPAGARAKLAAAADNPEIKTMVDADQAIRKTDWNTLTEEQRKANAAGDIQRNTRMQEIVAAGDVRTANDFARASLVMQHSARFAGYQLAHELAVCSMLLGDRQLGRWLVTATYDRMLRSVGHDQRFGTQYGPNGPLQVDETGICDAQRQALGCPTLAQARNRQARGSQVVNKLKQELLGPDNTLRDAANGVSARIPPGWTVADAAVAGERATSIAIVSPTHPDTSLGFYYRIHSAPPPAPVNGVEAFMREQAQTKEKDRQANSPDYKNRPDSFVFRELNGQPALSWTADFTRGDRKWSEYLTRILGKNSVALLFLNTSAEGIDALRPAVDGMAATVQLP